MRPSPRSPADIAERREKRKNQEKQARTISLPADIWAETIPFKETRGYVAAVFLYALIYQQRLQRDSLQPGQLLHTVRAG